MDQNRNDLLRHIRGLIDNRKREIQSYYAELKLKLPSNLKNLKIKDLQEAGATIDPMTIILSRISLEKIKADGEVVRKREKLIEKLQEIREDYKRQTRIYFTNMKSQIDPDLLKKTMKELDDSDLEKLGISVYWYNKINSRAKKILDRDY